LQLPSFDVLPLYRSCLPQPEQQLCPDLVRDEPHIGVLQDELKVKTIGDNNTNKLVKNSKGMA
jgi:hypothetical protein